MTDFEVTEGNRYELDYVLENRGDETTTEDVELRVDGTVVDSDPSITLDPGEETTGTLVTDAFGENDVDEMFNIELVGKNTRRRDIRIVPTIPDIVSIGGLDSDFNEVNDVYEYDPSADSWSSVAALPDALSFHAAASVDGKLYSIGGIDSDGNEVNDVYEYDPSADSWSSVAVLPDALRQHAAASVDGKLYSIGGFDSDSNAVNDVYEYDPSADSWSSVAVLPDALRHNAAASVDGKLYSIGGQDSDNNNVNDVYEYDPSADSWSSVAVLPDALRLHAAASFNE